MSRNLNKILGDQELKDPFSGSIDEFLMEKETKPAKETAIENLEDETEKSFVEPGTEITPQEKLEDKAENPHTDPEVEAPQDNLEDKSDDMEEESDEDNLDTLEEQKRDLQDQIENLKEGQETDIEASLKKVGMEISNRGYPAIASIFFKLVGG
jgi:hypothetical protein